jgi:hypothetical protein
LVGGEDFEGDVGLHELPDFGTVPTGAIVRCGTRQSR